MSIEENDLRKDLEAAFEQHTEEPASKEEGRPTEDSQEPIRATEAPQKAEGESGTDSASDGGEGKPGTRGRDEKGRFASSAEKPAGTQPEGAKPPAVDPAAKAPEQQPSAPDPIAPPQGWKAAAREHWAKLPREVQEEVSRREKETAKIINQTTQARQLATEFQNVVNPFMPLIQSQGSNPLQAVKNLMTTAAGLTVGTQQQKAQIVREIIQNYGIDIATLDAVLAGSPVPQGSQQAQYQQNSAPPPWANPIFQFMNTVQQQRAQREQQLVADAEAETAAFAEKHEFFEDVREDMADLMEMSAKRGVVMSMEDAYKKTIALNPEISRIVQQREAAKKATQQRQNIQNNRNAASSIAGGPKGGPAGNSGAVDDSRRAALAEAWDAQMGR